MQTDKVVKFLLILILIISVFKLPYGAYMLNRTLVTIGFGILAYNANKLYGENSNITLSCLGAALIFQPLWKIPFGRSLWVGIDHIIALILIFNLLRNTKNKFT